MARTMLMDDKLIDFLDTCSAYNSSHSKQSNAQEKQWQNSLRDMERKTSKCGALVVGKNTLRTSKLGSDLHADFDRKEITF
jgi:hypothetical protein